jgi:flagellar protein FliO/FliZ
MSMTILLWVLLPLAILAVGGWLAWQYLGAGRGLFGGGQTARIGLSEVASLDGKRRLLLIYRDGVEHLVMTGGPIDVVIEQGIQPSVQRRASPAPEGRAAAFEPRLASHPASGGQSDQGPEPQPGFSRLRQRPAPSVTAETSGRADQVGIASGNGNR